MRGVGLLDIFMTLVVLMLLIVLVSVVVLLVPATGSTTLSVDLSDADRLHENALLGRPIHEILTIKQSPIEEFSDEEPYSIAESIDRTGLLSPGAGVSEPGVGSLPPPPIAQIKVFRESMANVDVSSAPRDVFLSEDIAPEDVRVIEPPRSSPISWQMQINERIRILASHTAEVRYALE